jgi:hypothetical protein
MNPKLFDRRVVKRNITNGLITKEEYDKFVASLPDAASLSEPVREKLYGESESEEMSAKEADA